jgi:hypothetical protein
MALKQVFDSIVVVVVEVEVVVVVVVEEGSQNS